MPNRPISALPTSSTITGNEVLVTVQDGVTKKETINNLSNFTLNQVPTNNFVASGALNGSDLILTMTDGSTVTIDASNMINSSTLSATNDGWFFAFGDRANEAVGNSVSSLSAGIAGKAPFYFGTAIERGYEMKWNAYNNKSHVLGIWAGAEAEAGTYNSRLSGNWSTGFTYNGGYIAGSNTALTNTTATGKYVTTANAPVAIRFLSDGHITLVDLSVTPEVEIAKTINPIIETSFQMLLGCQEEFLFPNAIVQDNSGWEIVHDFDNSEAGIINGIEADTVLRSNISISPNEKIMFNLDRMGNGSLFGTKYIGASSGSANAKFELDNLFSYETNEALDFEIGSTQDWEVNTNSTYYFNNGVGVVGYRKNNANNAQGMFSLRYLSDNTITIYSEDNNEKVATAKINGDGNPIQLYYGAKNNVDYADIPAISKQTIGQVSEPLSTFKPTVADQTISVNEESALNYTIVYSGNIVNQFVEMNAPAWVSLNQSTGVLTGTTPTFTGTSADTITISCKAANVIGGATDFSITISILDV